MNDDWKPPETSLPSASSEPISPMQQAVLDSGAPPVEAAVPAFASNQGTVFLGSPADIARLELMDRVHVPRGRTYFPTNEEIDRQMKEDLMNSGKCVGGPFDGRRLHHTGPSYRIAIHHGARVPAIPGMVASADPGIEFGTYHFTGDGQWHWNPPAGPSSPA